MKENFVYLDEIVPNMTWDAKYATWDNFTGRPIDGYSKNRIIGTVEMAYALRNVALVAKEKGYGLLIWDAYRPQRAVNNFLEWAKLPEDGKRKAIHYPNIEKRDLILQGYVAEKSSHSRGSAVDLTLFDLSTKECLDMGGRFDYMDVKSHHDATEITLEEKKNREILCEIMTQNGFVSYDKEWWHYMLEKEPYPNTYFDFVA